MTPKPKQTKVRNRGRKPKISRDDLKNFFEVFTGGEEDLEIDEAIEMLSGALTFLKSASQDCPLPSEKECEKRHEEFFRMTQMRTAYSVVKWFLTGGLVTIAGAIAFFYTNSSNDTSPEMDRLIKVVEEDHKALLELRQELKQKNGGKGNNETDPSPAP